MFLAVGAAAEAEFREAACAGDFGFGGGFFDAGGGGFEVGVGVEGLRDEGGEWGSAGFADPALVDAGFGFAGGGPGVWSGDACIAEAGGWGEGLAADEEEARTGEEGGCEVRWTHGMHGMRVTRGVSSGFFRNQTGGLGGLWFLGEGLRVLRGGRRRRSG